MAKLIVLDSGTNQVHVFPYEDSDFFEDFENDTEKTLEACISSGILSKRDNLQWILSDDNLQINVH